MTRAELWEALREAALAYPETYEESPWGERVVKVRKKVFVFLGSPDGERFGCSVKLPISGARVLEEPWASPTGYGLGRSGWVSCSFGPGDEVPLERLLEFLDESFRAVAPKTVVRRLDEAGSAAVGATGSVPTRATAEGAVLVVGDGPLRRQRAVDALAARGLDALGCGVDDAVALTGEGAPDVVLVDVGRRPGDSAEVASAIGVLEGRLVVAGARSGRHAGELDAALPLAAPASREPPGDDRVVDQIVALLRR